MKRRQRAPQALSTRSLVFVSLLLGGCSGSPASEQTRIKDAKPALPSGEPGHAKPPPAKPGPRFVEHDPEAPLLDAVAKARAESQAQGRQFLVYVGASWCEPCRYFHDAVVAGELDQAFPRLDLIEFDLDQDKAELFAAGYESRLIPLFAKAEVDGKASSERHAGGIKGPKAVGFLTKKLEALLAEPNPAG